MRHCRRRPTAARAIRRWPAHRTSTAASSPWPARRSGRRSSAGLRFWLGQTPSDTRPSRFPLNSTIFSTTGTAIGFFLRTAISRLHWVRSSPPGISFPFYGTTYNSVSVNPHGVIVLTRVSVSGTQHRSLGDSDRRDHRAAVGQYHRQRFAPIQRLLQARNDQHRQPLGNRVVRRQLRRRTANRPGHVRGDPQFRRHDPVQLPQFRQQPAASRETSVRRSASKMRTPAALIRWSCR